MHCLQPFSLSHLSFAQLAVKVSALQIQMDLILAAIIFGGGMWVLKLVLPNLFSKVRYCCEFAGDLITAIFHKMYQFVHRVVSKLGFVRVVNNPEYHLDFQSKSNELAEHVTSLVSKPEVDNHFTCHGRVRMLLNVLCLRNIIS
jgi:hypothetical protein